VRDKALQQLSSVTAAFLKQLHSPAAAAALAGAGAAAAAAAPAVSSSTAWCTKFTLLLMLLLVEPPSPAVKAKVLQLFEGDGIPDCVIDGIARRCGIGSNGKLMYAKPTGEENFPVLELMRLQVCSDWQQQQQQQCRQQQQGCLVANTCLTCICLGFPHRLMLTAAAEYQHCSNMHTGT
jgi:hypothetical protein